MKSYTIVKEKKLLHSKQEKKDKVKNLVGVLVFLLISREIFSVKGGFGGQFSFHGTVCF